MTTWSLRSEPGISPTTLVACSTFSPDPVPDLDLDGHRDAALEDAVHPVVVLGRDRDDRRRGEHALARPSVVPRPRTRVAPDGAKPAALALQDDGHPLRLVEGQLLLGREQVGIPDRPRRRGPRRGDHHLLRASPAPPRSAAARHSASAAMSMGAGGVTSTAFPLSVPRYFSRSPFTCRSTITADARPAGRRCPGVGDRVADHRRVVGLQHLQREVLVVPGRRRSP